MLVHYKLYTICRAFPTIFGLRSYSTKLRNIKACERFLASVINEIQRPWDERFDESNHLPHVFGPNVTGIRVFVA